MKKAMLPTSTSCRCTAPQSHPHHARAAALPAPSSSSRHITRSSSSSHSSSRVQTDPAAAAAAARPSPSFPAAASVPPPSPPLPHLPSSSPPLNRRALLHTSLSAMLLLSDLPATASPSPPPAPAPAPSAAVPAAAPRPPGIVVPRRQAGQRIPKVKLPCGLGVSKVIKGCWQLDGAHRGEPRSDRTSGAEAVADFDRFLAAGITSFDTADIYGPSESLIGQYLRLNPGVRDQVQVLTKITFMEEDMGRLSKDMLEYRVRASMRRMGVYQLDLIQLHWEDFRAPGYLDAAKWLADMQGTGLIKHIGLTNFDTQHMIEVLDSGVKIASNQVQYSVLDRRPELYMSELCESKGISIIPYGVLAGGFLSSKFVDAPASKALLDTLSKAKYGTQLKEQGGWRFVQEMLQALKEVSVKHGVSVSAVALRWVLDQVAVDCAVVGARNGAHLRDVALALGDWALDEEDMLTIDAAYEGATAQPSSDCFVWERGGAW